MYYTKDAYTKYGVTLLKTNFKISGFCLFNPSPPKIWLSILPSSYNTSPCKIDYVNLVFNQGNKLYLMSLSILTTCLLL